MKKRFSKLLSALLILSFLVSAFSVLAVAETAGTETGESVTAEKTDSYDVFINRGFEDGWDYNNGFSKAEPVGNKFYIDYEEDNLGKYNYFVRYEAASEKQGATTILFEGQTVNSGTTDDIKATVVEFSIKADDLAYLGNIMWMATGTTGTAMNLLDIDENGNLIVFPQILGGNKNLGKLENNWVNIALVFDWMAPEGELVCTLHYGYGYNSGYQTVTTLNMSYPAANDVGMKSLSFGLRAGASRKTETVEESYGMSYCLDNLKVYHGVTGIIDIEDTEFGSKVDPLAEKVIEVRESADYKTKAELLESSLAMKIGVDFALADNVRYALKGNYESAKYKNVYGSPVKQGENILVPLQLILDYIGFPSYTHPDGQSLDITTGTSKTYITIGRSSATVDGERVELALAPGYLKNADGKDYLVIALSDVATLFPGWLTIYDTMGLVILYEDLTPENLEDNAPLVTRENDLEAMVGLMKKFVFDITKADKADDTYNANGQGVAEKVKNNTQGFAHPYIIADADVFAKLKAAYNLSEGDEGYNAVLKAYLQQLVDKADAYYNENANSASGNYTSIKADKLPEAPLTSDGYNAFGKLDVIVEATENLPLLAFAYQITGNNNYAKFAYDWIAALGEWKHWGPSYMEHCSAAVANVAIAYDWFYNAYKALALDTNVIASIIYNQGVHAGYVSSSGGLCEWPRTAADMSGYVTSKDSINATNSSSMIIAALSILDYVSSENVFEDDADAYNETVYLLGNNIVNLAENGLDIYAPDGSYIESAVHWEKATSAFFRMAMALVSSTGSDYGFMSTWGIDKTCYYACHIESSDGFIWNYHDGGGDGFSSGDIASLNTDMFNFVGAYFKDAALINARAKQLEAGKAVSIYDLIFYPFDGIEEAGEIELDYFMEGIDGFVARSDWEEGALYTGLMGGPNGATNGQLDSGNFIYYNKGITWIMDLGSENTNVSTYNAVATRYKHYRASAEGQNVISIADSITQLANGQAVSGSGQIINYYSNEFGSYAILDNTSSYLSKVTYASRGVLLTNDRSTVVLQDEFSFHIIETLLWVLHTTATIELSNDGRTAYLTEMSPDGEIYTLRVSIVSQRPDFQFTVKDATENLLSGTYAASAASGATTEYSRANIKKLVIEGSLISFDCAVVFELLDPAAKEEPPVQYEWTSMKFWEPVKSSESDDVVVTTRPQANKADIRTSTVRADLILDGDDPYTENLAALYKAITLVEYTLKTYKPETLDSTLASAYGDFTDIKKDYEKFLKYANGVLETSDILADSLIGMHAEEAEEE